MQCYTELTPPTAVTHSLTLQFVPSQGTNLAVAKSSLLQIFRTRIVSAEVESPESATRRAKAAASRYEGRLANDDDGLEVSFLGHDSLATRADRASTTKLVLIAEFSLPGTITGLAPNTSYSYVVSAYDAAANNSPNSASLNATTTSTPD